MFFTFLALSGSGLEAREADDPIKPISATRTIGIYQIETVPRICGTRLTMTAETKRLALVRAAALATFKTARALTTCTLSYSASTITFATCLPRLERKATNERRKTAE